MSEIISKTKLEINEFNQDKIMYIQAKKNYIYIKRVDNNVLIIKQTLEKIERDLENKKFIKTHKSFLVNCTCILNYSKKTCCVTLTSGEKIPVSRRQKGCVLDLASNSSIAIT